MKERNPLYNFVHLVIKKVWQEDIKVDYENLLLLKEDSFKNAFYYHLRRRIGDDYLKTNNLRIFTEFYIEGERIDLVIAEINPLMAEEEHLGYCITKIVAGIEMKHKGKYASEKLFDKDISKVIAYSKKLDFDTMLYVAFIREKYFYSDEVTYWMSDDQIELARGKVTELYSYIDAETENMVWLIEEHL
ncbi:hypothetical protein V7075_13525 [Neobacillus drentensis]|uniref:hypothetical protein n=1 Tax=Neobacillus drentensis TaxID=220684 RepID=UPI002FFE1933